MSYQLFHLDALSALRSAAGAWDDLWRRSEVVMPLACAEPLAMWYEHFAPAASVRILVVAEQDRFVAALPLVGGRLGRCLPVGRLPACAWSLAGDLLVDEQAAWDPVLDTLAKGVSRLAWPLLWFDGVPVETPRWRALRQATQRAGWPTMAVDQPRVAEVALAADWDAYLAGRSRNHRRNIRRASRRFSERGGRLLVYDDPSPDRVDALITRGFEVERRSWKHRSGSTVIDTPGMLDFYCRQARYLAGRGQLMLAVLEHEGRAISFHYGYRAKASYLLMKIAYDTAFADWSPGRLLMAEMIRWLHENQTEIQRIDFLGPVSSATMPWKTGTYGLGRLVVAPGGRFGETLLRAYRQTRPWFHRLPATGHQPQAKQEPRSTDPCRPRPSPEMHADTHV